MHRDRNVFAAITFRRAQVLRELADGYSETEAASHLGISVSGFRATVQQLKDLTGCTGVRELGRWWRANRDIWIQEFAAGGGGTSFCRTSLDAARPSIAFPLRKISYAHCRLRPGSNSRCVVASRTP